MLELPPGMVSRICESFKGLHLMVAGSFHDARTEDQPLPWMAESDIRLKKSVSAHGGTWAIETNPLLTPTPSLNQSRHHPSRNTGSPMGSKTNMESQPATNRETFVDTSL